MTIAEQIRGRHWLRPHFPSPYLARATGFDHHPVGDPVYTSRWPEDRPAYRKGAEILSELRRVIERARRVVVCSVEDEAWVREALAAVGIGPDDPLWTVQPNVFMEAGQVLILPTSSTIMASIR